MNTESSETGTESSETGTESSETGTTMTTLGGGTLRPLQDRVFIRRLEAAANTPGGLALPAHILGKPLRGRVVAVGPGAALKGGAMAPMVAAVGDLVLFGQHTGTDIKIDGETLLTMRDSDIFAVIELDEGEGELDARISQVA